jgi:hypothetical protein
MLAGWIGRGSGRGGRDDSTGSRESDVEIAMELGLESLRSRMHLQVQVPVPDAPSACTSNSCWIRMMLPACRAGILCIRNSTLVSSFGCLASEEANLRNPLCVCVCV